MSAPDAVRVSTHVALDPAAAFEVFTEDIDVWWKRGPMYRFDARRTDGVMHFEPGPDGRLFERYGDGDEFEVGRVRAWEPPDRLAFEWRLPNFAPGESTEVELSFVATETGTRVTLEHSGWSRLRPDHPARHGLADEAYARMLGGWWTDQFVSLRTRSTTHEKT